MAHGQQNMTRYFFAYWANGDMHNDVRDAPSPMSPKDLKNIEEELQMAGDYDIRPTIINFRRMNE